MDTAHDTIARAPLPTPRTLRRRQNLAYQAWRFVATNLRMIRMVTKGSH